ncbi:flap endonuclease [bacterium SCSIO 12696]|nr:flap endonuclease [bacterium SCSIO 12696]
MTVAKAYLIDASIYFFRHYFALPDNWHSTEGYATNGVQGYTNWLLTLLQKQQPRYVATAHDESLGTGFRHQLFPAYKANRALPDEALEFQLRASREVAEILGVAHFASHSHEADDIIGTLANLARSNRCEPVIISRDKDLTQLLQPGECMWDFGSSEANDRAHYEAKLGIGLPQMADYLALVGDPTDNIPGVPGIGPKTAVALLNHFADIDTLLANLDQLLNLPIRGASGIAQKLAPLEKQLQLTRQLTAIHCDAPLGVEESQFDRALQWQGVDHKRFEDFCHRMGLGRQLLMRAGRLNGT